MTIANPGSNRRARVRANPTFAHPLSVAVRAAARRMPPRLAHDANSDTRGTLALPRSANDVRRGAMHCALPRLASGARDASRQAGGFQASTSARAEALSLYQRA